ncbi:unnamed protein product, partial [Xyrichtys novacula]
KCGVRPALVTCLTSGHLQVMREYPNTVSVVWEEILSHPPSRCGSLTDRKSEEQQAYEVVSSTIDCQLTSEVHYTDRPELQHDDLHSRYVLITNYESLTGTNLSHARPLCAPSCFLSTVHLSGLKSIGLNFPLSV